jgi:hypothetical protein
MKQLRSIFAQYFAVAPRMGTSGASPGQGWNGKQLRSDLRRVGRKNASLAWICIGMLIVLFLINCALVLKFSNRPDLIKEASAGIGVSLAGVAIATIKFWKTKLLADVFVVVASNMEPGEIQEVMQLLLQS